MREWIGPGVLGALALLAVGLVVVLVVVARTRTRSELRAAQAEAATLRAQMDELERRVAGAARSPRPTGAQVSGAPEYVITHLGEEIRVPRHASHPAGDPAPEHGGVRIDSALFADLVLRETVVKAAALAYGVRLALAPASRNRIRFEMRQEVKRARKQRRAELKQARRDHEARQRAGLVGDEDAA